MSARIGPKNFFLPLVYCLNIQILKGITTENTKYTE